MTPALAGGRGTPRVRPRLHIRVNQITAPEELPDQVVLLDRFARRLVHYLPEKPGLPDRFSKPCRGDKCMHCFPENGRKPIARRPVNYAPVLISSPGEQYPDGSPIWTRAVLHIPDAAVKWFTDARGAFHTCHRKNNRHGRGTRVVANFVCYCHELQEPAFPIDPVVDYAAFTGEETKRELERMLDRLPSEITPPVVKPPAVPTDLESKLDSLQRTILRQQEMMTRQQEMMAQQQAAIEQAMKEGRWPGTRRPGEQSAPSNVDGETLRGIKDTIKFQGKTITEREQDGSYQPKPTGTEGGAE